MKTHNTITITAKWLASRGACKDGRKDVEALLPATISTDPVENIELAEALIAATDGAGRFNGSTYSNIDWLTDRCRGNSRWPLDSPDSDYSTTRLGNWTGAKPHEDPYVVAQWLAFAADAWLMCKGR